MHNKIAAYVRKWKRQGYLIGIPDTVPDGLMDDNLAPSYRQVAIAILKNDHGMVGLGFSAKRSEWYSVLKREEFARKDSENAE